MKYLLVITIAITILSCNRDQNKENTSSVEKIENHKVGITLIFKNVPEEVFVPFSKNNPLSGREYFNNIASYRDLEGIEYHINPKRKSSTDTIHIPINRRKVEIYFNRFGMEGYSYLFNNGDQIQIEYKNGNPEIKILNRPTKTHDYNFEQVAIMSDSGNNVTPFEKFYRQLDFPDTDQPFSRKEYTLFHRRNLEKKSKNLIDALITQKKLLDSLENNDLISADIHEYYHEKLRYINWSRLAKLKILPVNGGDSSFAKFEENIDRTKSTIGLDTIFTEVNFTLQKIIKNGDSLLMYRFYHDFLYDNFMPNYIENKTTKNIFSYGNFGGEYFNWADVFDSVRTSALFSKKVKDFLQYKYMMRIAEDLSPETTRKYYNLYKDETSSNKYLDIINGTFELDQSITNKLKLLDQEDGVYYLEDIIEENVGKVILIDFWASWCAPCIDAIPEANQLRKQLKDRNFVYISVATDENSDLWKSSLVKKAITDSKHNYILKSPYLSNFIKEYHVIYVPRYILIDQKGNVVDRNAPGPRDSETRKLLDQYLTE